MSWEMIKAIKGVGPAILKPAEKGVLIWLAVRANEEGEAWPGPADIAEATNHNHRTVRRALDRLEYLGLILEIGKAEKGVRKWRIIPPPTPGVGPAGRSTPPGPESGGHGSSARTTPGATSPTPGVGPSKYQEPHSIHTASGSAPDGAQASTEKRKPTPEEIAARSAEFARIRAEKERA